MSKYVIHIGNSKYYRFFLIDVRNLVEYFQLNITIYFFVEKWIRKLEMCERERQKIEIFHLPKTRVASIRT